MQNANCGIRMRNRNNKTQREAARSQSWRISRGWRHFVAFGGMHTIGETRCLRHGTRSAHEPNEQQMRRRRRPRLQLSQVFSWSSVFSLRFELDAPSTQRDDDASSKIRSTRRSQAERQSVR